MDNRLKEIVDKMDQYKIGLDDPFRFKCRGCGKCCKNREDILFTVRDLFRIAKYFKKPISEIIKKYCDCYMGSDSHFPIVRLMTQGTNKSCPFLDGKRCSIHEVKPVVCALYPVGRTWMAEKDSIEGSEPKYIPGYILQPMDCGSVRKMNTVRQWLEKFDIPIEDEFYLEWNKALILFSTHIQEMEKCASGKVLQPIYNLLFELIYVQYDTEAELIPQFRMNIKKATKFIHEIKNVLQSAAGGESDDK